MKDKLKEFVKKKKIHSSEGNQCMILTTHLCLMPKHRFMDHILYIYITWCLGTGASSY